MLIESWSFIVNKFYIDTFLFFFMCIIFDNFYFYFVVI